MPTKGQMPVSSPFGVRIIKFGNFMGKACYGNMLESRRFRPTSHNVGSGQGLGLFSALKEQCIGLKCCTKECMCNNYFQSAFLQDCLPSACMYPAWSVCILYTE